MGTLEEAIKQSVFKNNVRKALINIIYTANWIRDKHSPIFKEYGILQQHYNVLRIVKGRKGEAVSPGQILKVMIDKGRDLTRLVDKLVKKGYLERSICSKNRRKVDIHITSEGIRITDEIEQRLSQISEDIFDLTEEEAHHLNHILDKMRGEY